MSRWKIGAGVVFVVLAGVGSGWFAHWQIRRQGLSHDEAVRRVTIGM